MTEQTEPQIYQGFGTVEGILNLHPQDTTLLVGETVFRVIGFITSAVRHKHQPGQRQHFKVYPTTWDGKVAFKVLRVSSTATVGITLKGCWEDHLGVSYLVVYRNQLPSSRDSRLRTLVPIAWENAPAADGQYWELEAEVQGGELRVREAIGPFPPPPQACQSSPPQVRRYPLPVKKTDKVKPAPALPVPPLTIEEIREMTTPAKVQLTCKLNQVPEYRELPDRRLEFFLSEGTSPVFTVRMKPKLFKKLTDHGYENWVGAITGELGEVTETGFELQNVAVQVFEKSSVKESKAPGQIASTAVPPDSSPGESEGTNDPLPVLSR